MVDDRGRGARLARRDEGAYCWCVTEEQRGQPGCVGREGDRLRHSMALKCQAMRLWSALWVLPALLVACASASDLILSVSISNESLKVTDGAFGGSLSGSFQLQLTLGSEANGSTEVSLGKFELQTEAGAFLANLDDATPEPMFPIQLNKGESKRVVFTLDGISVDREKACAGRVRIVGSLMDTLKGGAVPVQSGLITPDCG